MAKVLISETVVKPVNVYPECPYAGKYMDGGNGWNIVPCMHPRKTQEFCSSCHIPPVNCPF